MTTRRAPLSVSAILALGLLAPTAPSAARAAAACSSSTPPTFSHTTPSPLDVLGFEAGSREASAAEINTYLHAVDAARGDVTVATMATSVEGRPIDYAVVGAPAAVTAAQAAARALRDPTTSPAQASAIAASAPAIAWMAGNVHGTEESGADAALRLLYELSDRTDCAARAIRDTTVVVIVPTQNPDGREAQTRRNAYGFDLNRDWFARTQPETDGKLTALAAYPPVLLTDNHEYGGNKFFFPPNADPVHHEIADRSIDWIMNTYGTALAAEFQSRKWAYFNYATYDLFYMGYGDTFPTAQGLGAAMTFEQGNGAKIAARTDHQFWATWAAFSALAADKAAILEGWAANHREAVAEGEAGLLEPNAVFAPGSTLQLQVPQELVRSYFLLDDPAKADETQRLIRRLQLAEVDVRRLTAPLDVPDYRAYGEPARAATLPAGTFYIPMAQARKHWIQALLGEDSYAPFPYFYDLTAWSNPLLSNVPGGRSGAQLAPASEPLALLADPAPPTPPHATPRIGLWLTDDGTSAFESEGWTRWLLDRRWSLPYRKLTTADVASGALDQIDVLLVPDGNAKSTASALGKKGRATLTAWVGGGGRYVGWRGGAELAARLQLTATSLDTPTSDIPGSLIRVVVAGSGVGAGVGGTAWVMYEYDPVLRAPSGVTRIASYPAAADLFVSGYQRGAEELAGTAAATAEQYSAGRVVLFASDPNFRGFTDGTQRLLWNAIFTADPAARAADAARRSAATARAAASAGSLGGFSHRATATLRSRSAADGLAAAIGGGAVRLESLPGGLWRVSWPVAEDRARVELDQVLSSVDSRQLVSARVP